MAPERYIALPPRSVEAAKALVAVLVVKGEEAVRALENFRIKQAKPGPEGGEDGWFDMALGPVLGHGMGEEVETLVNRLKTLKFPHNDSLIMRTAQLPLECLDPCMYAGMDLSKSCAPRGGVESVVVAEEDVGQQYQKENEEHQQNDSDIEIVSVSVKKPAKPARAGKKKSPRTIPSLKKPPPRQRRVSPRHEQVPQEDVPNEEPEKQWPEPNAPPPGMDMDFLRDIPVPRLNALGGKRDTLSAARANLGATAAPSSTAVQTMDRTEGNPIRYHVPVSLVFDDLTGKVSIDFDVIPISSGQPTVAEATEQTSLPASQVMSELMSQPVSQATPPPAPKPTQQPAHALQPSTSVSHLDFSLPLTMQHDGDSLHIRSDAPPSQLDALLEDVDPSNERRAPTTPSLGQRLSSDVVMLEGDKEAGAPKSPGSALRRGKRRRTRASGQEEAALQTEQRASELRSKVMSALHTERRRKRPARTSVANGHPRTKARPTPSRPSRKVRRTSNPIIDSDSDDRQEQDSDKDYNIEEDVLEILPPQRLNGERSIPLPPSLSPLQITPSPRATTKLRSPRNSKKTPREEPIDLDGGQVEPRPIRTKTVSKAEGGPSSRSRQHNLPRRGGSSRNSPDVPDLNPPSQSASPEPERPLLEHRPFQRRRRPPPVVHREEEEEEELDGENAEREPHLWDRELACLDRLVRKHDTGSPSATSSDSDEDGPYYDDMMPILKRILVPIHRGDRCIMDYDQPEEEYNFMKDYYRKNRNAPPYAPDHASPGTKFLLETYERVKAARERRTVGEEPIAVHRDVDAVRARSGPPSIEEPMDMDPVSYVDVEIPQELSSGKSTPTSSVPGSSEDEPDTSAAGTKRTRAIARHRASKARELQSRVCGVLLTTMQSECKRKVLRWAEKDFEWFEKDSEWMEIVASKVMRRCDRCDIEGEEENQCEETILLKLWKDLSWRKVRRMRHRRQTDEFEDKAESDEEEVSE